MTPLPCRISASPVSAGEIEADWLVLGVPVDSASDSTLAKLDGQLGGTIGQLRDRGDLTGKQQELVSLLSVPGLRAHRLLLVGLGPRGEWTRSTIHNAFATALRSITGRKYGRVAVVVPESTVTLDPRSTAIAAAVAAVQACFGPGLRKSEPDRFVPDELTFLGTPDSLLGRIRAEATAIAYARELVNTPPSDLYPESFAARAVAECGPIQCEIWDEHRLEAEKMGAILGVARAAARPPRFVVMRYRNGGDALTLALVGKGVTFDSGGLSLKANDQMVDMKCDMAGAAAVLAAIRAVAELGLRVNLLGLLPLVENMPGGRALKLGDVLRARNGKTIEVLNTDAEGRLILADALAYAAEQRPGHIVDLATLTGACMIALGTEIAGLMTNDESWGSRIRTAAQQAGERVWPLPLDADFADLLKSKVADWKNVPPSRYGGAIAGGKFLEQFVAGIPWAHLDIAGPAWADHDSPARDPGGTGAYVRTLIELAGAYSS